MRQVKIVSGVSGSGKSRYAGKLLTDYIASLGITAGQMMVLSVDSSDKRATSAYCNADGFFMSDGVYHFDASKLSLAHGKCFRDFIRAVTSEVEFVVVDNTNTTVAEISPYVLGGEAFGYDVEIVTVDISHDAKGIEKCAARNAHGVPVQGIHAQQNRLMSRSLPPWWKNRMVYAEF